jgi:hypothetical protein
MLTAVSTALTRRALLGTPVLLTAAVVAGCTDDEQTATPEDPDRVALETALDVELALFVAVGSLDGADGVVPVSTVQAHIDALDEALGQEPTPTSEPTAVPPTDVAEAARAADRAADAHTRAVRDASPEISPLLASVAASDAALAAFLRQRR